MTFVSWKYYGTAPDKYKEVKKMKFEIGDLVYIKKEMPSYMSHFHSGKFVIITEKSQASGDYMTNIGGWYEENQLILIKKNPNHKLLEKLNFLNKEK